MLNRMNDRTAQWYYASSMANAGVGNNVLAGLCCAGSEYGPE